jgi:uncharacterized membrane protein YphA (DoxX/SURF4 family)
MNGKRLFDFLRSRQPLERENLRQIVLSDWIYRIVRLVYVVLFLYAGVNKLLSPKAFATVIDAFGLVPDPLIMPIAFALPILEIVAALGLLFDVRGSLGLVTGLLVFFMAVVSYGIWMGLDIDCGCFGPGDLEGEAYRGLRPAFYRNIVLMAGIAYLYSWRFIRAVKPVRLEWWFSKFDGFVRSRHPGENRGPDIL